MNYVSKIKVSGLGKWIVGILKVLAPLPENPGLISNSLSGSQPSVALNPGNPRPLPCLHEYQLPLWFTDIHADKIPVYITKIFKKNSSFITHFHITKKSKVFFFFEIYSFISCT